MVEAGAGSNAGPGHRENIMGTCKICGGDKDGDKPTCDACAEVLGDIGAVVDEADLPEFIVSKDKRRREWREKYGLGNT